MIILIERLKKTLEMISFQKVAIYGIGYYAKSLLSVVDRLGLQNKVSCFIVSELQPTMIYVEKPIMLVKEFGIYVRDRAEDFLIIVAVNATYIGMIQTNIESCIYGSNVLYLSDYVHELDNSLELLRFRNKNFKDYCKLIAMWYEYENAIEEYSLQNLADKIYKQAIDRKFYGKQIVIIIGSATTRTLRICKELKKHGYSIKIIQLKQNRQSYVSEEDMQRDFEFISCDSVRETMFEMLRTKPLVYIIQAPYNDSTIAEIVIRKKAYFGKVIFTSYDICNGTYIGLPQYRYESEKYALENADGVIWRYYSKEFLRNRMGFSYSGKMLQFPDYCSNSENQIEYVVRDRNILKLCAVMSDTQSILEIPALEYSHTSILDEILPILGHRADVAFHLYVWRADEQQRLKLQGYEEKYDSFKAFIHIDNKILLRKMHEYDYGVCFQTDGIIPEWPEGAGSGDIVAYSEGNYRYSMVNRYFEYIQQGLPIISTHPITLCDELEKFGVLVRMTPNTIDVGYLKDNRDKYHKNVVEAKNKLCIGTNIDKFIKLLEAVGVEN